LRYRNSLSRDKQAASCVFFPLV